MLPPLTVGWTGRAPWSQAPRWRTRACRAPRTEAPSSRISRKRHANQPYSSFELEIVLMSSKFGYLPATLILSGVLVAPDLHAQAPVDEEATLEIAEVIVSARRRDERLQDV